jgi:hypothetical protein
MNLPHEATGFHDPSAISKMPGDVEKTLSQVSLDKSTGDKLKSLVELKRAFESESRVKAGLIQSNELELETLRSTIAKKMNLSSELKALSDPQYESLS